MSEAYARALEVGGQVGRALVVEQVNPWGEGLAYGQGSSCSSPRRWPMRTTRIISSRRCLRIHPCAQQSLRWFSITAASSATSTSPGRGEGMDINAGQQQPRGLASGTS
jgi:hypothetical protein